MHFARRTCFGFEGFCFSPVTQLNFWNGFLDSCSPQSERFSCGAFMSDVPVLRMFIELWMIITNKLLEALGEQCLTLSL